ncbi:Cystine-knot cytokine [Cinara cedri]|uniref:Cystine-knot cytokine n=1 Tax=Cinara cedri TaxID=506608 RepID=A0A5E4NMG1_9HEMI|nr:Cystine-knot cytokine [Cinara cedri]
MLNSSIGLKINVDCNLKFAIELLYMEKSQRDGHGQIQVAYTKYLQTTLIIIVIRALYLRLTLTDRESTFSQNCGDGIFTLVCADNCVRFAAAVFGRSDDDEHLVVKKQRREKKPWIDYCLTRLTTDIFNQVPPWDRQWRETGLRRFDAAKDTVESAKGIAKTMLIDRLQSLIAVLITLIGVLLANSASEPYLPADWSSHESHRQSNNKSLNSKNSQDWSSVDDLLQLKQEVADHHWLSGRKSLEYLRLISNESEEDCCPSQMEMIEPSGGSNPDGLYVELFSDGADKQRFYEVSCKPGVEGKPCLFMERKLHVHSKCVQRYSYSYAIVREENARHHHGSSYANANANNNNNNGNGKQTFQSLFPNDNNVWKLDYIKVRSGCACSVQSPKKKQKKHPWKNGSGGGGSSTGGKSSSPQ